jgi:hypothetical protein
MIGQSFLEAVPGEPADRQIDLRLAQEPPVVDDADKPASISRTAASGSIPGRPSRA